MTNHGKMLVDTLLAESFKELAVTQPIEKITIKEITDKAGVIRSTFYNHFQEKYDLLEWIVSKDRMDPVKLLIQNGMSEQAVVIILRNIEQEKEFYMRASRLEGQNSFEEIVKHCITEQLIEILENSIMAPHIPSGWLTKERIAAYHAQSLAFLVISWIQSGMEVSPQEMVAAYNYMIHNSITEIIGDE